MYNIVLRTTLLTKILLLACDVMDFNIIYKFQKFIFYKKKDLKNKHFMRIKHKVPEEYNISREVTNLI